MKYLFKLKSFTLSGNCDSTSFFKRRKRNGRKTLCKRLMISKVSSGLSSTFSHVVANGALNHCSNVVHDLNIDGRRKFNNAHNSGSLFCNGVPVNNKRCGAI